MTLRPFATLPAMDPGLNRRTAVLACAYALVTCASLYLAYEIRFDFVVPDYHQVDRLRLLPLALGIKMLALIAARQLGSMMTYFSIPDLLRIVWAMGSASIVLFLLRFFETAGLSAPRGVLLIDLMLCVGGLCVGRLATRLYRERLSGTKRVAVAGVQQQQQRIAIIGAGDAGAALAKEFLGSPARGFRPVMFFDDDPEKHGKLVHGIPVIGRPETMASAKEIASVAKAVIAMPSATAKRTRDVIMLCTQQGLKVETLPSMEELASGRVKASRIRPVEVQDLLGRDAVNLDSDAIRHSLGGRVVMVTGAGGSIGSELCRQIAALHPKRLLMVEQAEGALFTIEQELNETGVGGPGVVVPLVADIVDTARIEYIFARYQPEVVFHAAAHKHVYMMERQPAEAIRNNAIGTRQLAEIAAAHGCGAFVLISTDKAINPTSVMGATKRLAELQLMAVAARQSNGALAGRPEFRNSGIPASDKKVIGFQVAAEAAAQRPEARDQMAAPGLGSQLSALSSQLKPSPHKATKFMAVRFGNVLGSSGSVIPIFKRQIANGGPVTVTHPDVTRYFMTIPEAVGLVLQSFVLGKGGEIFVLDMGQPVKIVDLARQMIELSGFRVGDDIEIKFTGLKPGEKLFEELQHNCEEYSGTAHPRIMKFVRSSRAAIDDRKQTAGVDSRRRTADGGGRTADGNGQMADDQVIDEAALEELQLKLHSMDSNQLKLALQKFVPEYTPFLE